VKDLYNENYKPLEKEIKVDFRRWNDLPCSWIGRIIKIIRKVAVYKINLQKTVFLYTTMQYKFFSAAHGTFSKIIHIIGHKAILNKFKKVETIPCIISDHNKIKLELDNKRNHRKHSSTWILYDTLLNDQWVTKEIREEIKKFLESNADKNTIYQNLWDTANTVLKEKCKVISVYITKNRGFSNKQLNDVP
jgi:hypothetical protein